MRALHPVLGLMELQLKKFSLGSKKNEPLKCAWRFYEKQMPFYKFLFKTKIELIATIATQNRRGKTYHVLYSQLMIKIS